MSKEAMKLALEALKVTRALPEDFNSWQGHLDAAVSRDKAIKALEEALASEQEQRSDSEQLGEPFGWYDMEHGEIRDVEWNRLKPTYEGVWRPLYTTPQQRTWVGLTDEELADISSSGLSLWVLWRAIEAKLKEKNT